MKQARAAALDELEALLGALRRHGALKERSRGAFYYRSRAALHFHSDSTDLFADFRAAKDRERFPVMRKPDQAALLQRIAQILDEDAQRADWRGFSSSFAAAKYSHANAKVLKK